jgi:hypothetical protein
MERAKRFLKKKLTHEPGSGANNIRQYMSYEITSPGKARFASFHTDV